MSTLYAKLENGALIRAPKMMDVGENHVWNPTAEQLTAAGYKPVEITGQPEAPAGYEYVPGWEEREAAIVRTWTLAELPPEEPGAEEILDILLGGEEQ